MEEKLCGLAKRLLGRINRLNLKKKTVFYDKYQDIRNNDILSTFIENLIFSNPRGSENKIQQYTTIWK